MDFTFIEMVAVVVFTIGGLIALQVSFIWARRRAREEVVREIDNDAYDAHDLSAARHAGRNDWEKVRKHYIRNRLRTHSERRYQKIMAFAGTVLFISWILSTAFDLITHGLRTEHGVGVILAAGGVLFLAARRVRAYGRARRDVIQAVKRGDYDAHALNGALVAAGGHAGSARRRYIRTRARQRQRHDHPVRLWQEVLGVLLLFCAGAPAVALWQHAQQALGVLFG